MANNDVTNDAASYSASQGRPTMGNEGAKFSSPSAKPTSGKLVPKGNTAAGDPTGAGTKANRSNVAGAPGGERKGAAYSIKATYMKSNSPEAGMTMSNSPIIPAVTKRGFSQGLDSSY
jgi:hypothetical protein